MRRRSPRSVRLLTVAGSLAACGASAACDVLVGFPDAPVFSDGGTDGGLSDLDATAGHDTGHPRDAKASDVTLKLDVAKLDGPRPAEAGVCVTGAQRCVGQTFSETCVAGEWSLATACASGMCGDAGCVPPLVPASCNPPNGATAGITDCGVNLSGDCCASEPVPSGAYYRTFSYMPGPGMTTVLGGEANMASVSSFRLDAYDVTVGRFLQYVEYIAGGGAMPAQGSGKHSHLNGGAGLVNLSPDAGTNEPGWQAAWNAYIPSTTTGWMASILCAGTASTWGLGSDHYTDPINCVTWPQAYAFCIWDGGFLPTESEWELAAVGGSSYLQYPWGQMAEATAAFVIEDGNYPGSSPEGGVGTFHIAPVGTASSGVGPYGQLDLLGDVQVWTLDSYATPYAAAPCADCVVAHADLTTARSVRGANYLAVPAAVPTATFRSGATPTTGLSTLGFRCARAPAAP